MSNCTSSQVHNSTIELMAPTIAPGLRTYSAYEVLTTEFAPRSFLVDGLLPVGLTSLAGDPKIGKSWLALQLALSVSTGQRFLDHDVLPGRALYLSLEDSLHRLQERMRKQGWPQDAGTDFIPLNGFATQLGFLNRGGLKALHQHVQQNQYRLVIVDTLSRAISGDKNEEEVVTQALTPIQIMAQDENCAVLVIDHMKKGRGDDYNPITDVLGSVAKSAMCDTVWGLYRKPGQVGAKLVAVSRDCEETELAIQFNNRDCVWSLSGSSESLSPHFSTLLDLVSEHGPIQSNDVARLAGKDTSNTHKDLQKLHDLGRVHREEVGQYVYYSTL